MNNCGLEKHKFSVCNLISPALSPMGRKFRSQNEVRRYLEQISSELCPDLFCFNPYAQAGTPSARKRGGPTSKAAGASSSVKKLTNKAVKAIRAKSLGGAGDGSSTKLKLKFDFSKRMGRPPSSGKRGRPPADKTGESSSGTPGRPASTGKPGRPVSTGKPGRPVSTGKLGRPVSTGKPGRPAGKLGRPVSTGKPGRPPGKPGRPVGSLASPPLRSPASKTSHPTTPRTAVPATTPVKSECYPPQHEGWAGS